MPLLKSSVKILLVFALLVPSRAAVGQNLEAELRSDVAFLADSLQRGREFGRKETLGVGFYIYKSFKEAGLWTRFQSFSRGDVVGRNVVGFTPGFYDNYIVVATHYDGLGAKEAGSDAAPAAAVAGGIAPRAHLENFYPGADSNASGVAALLAVVRELRDIRSRTGIIFVAFDGFSADMSGSQAFLRDLGRDYRITAMVNLDILGSSAAPVREDRPDYLIALGGGAYSWDLSRLNRETDLYLSYDYYGSSRFTSLFYNSMSDQKWFLEKKIPCVMFTSGITMDTNKVTDTPDKLDYPVFARRVRLISLWLRHFVQTAA